MARYRLQPAPAQEKALLEHCAHARYVWNLACEVFRHGTLETYGEASRCTRRNGESYTHQKHRPVRQPPGLAEQCRQLTEARAEFAWLREGSAVVQQQALRDFDQARRNFLGGTHGYPKPRKKYRREGFRIVGKRGQGWDVRRLSRKTGAVLVPKVGWVRFRWSRPVPESAKSYRITRDRAGRWHLAFAVIPDPVPAPGTGETVGVDCGVAITAALSTGEALRCPGLTGQEQARLRKAERRASRAPKGSAAREAEYCTVTRLYARGSDLRKDWAEKVSTDLARRFDVIRFEDLRIQDMTARPAPRPDPDQPGSYLRNGARAKAGLARAIMAQGWGILATRTIQKAPGRVEKVRAAYTSLRCSGCGWTDKNSRKSQAEFACVHCGFTCNADHNAAINIAAGHAGGTTRAKPQSVREPQRAAVEILTLF